jgi:hypothetical protein
MKKSSTCIKIKEVVEKLMDPNNTGINFDNFLLFFVGFDVFLTV